MKSKFYYIADYNGEIEVYTGEYRTGKYVYSSIKEAIERCKAYERKGYIFGSYGTEGLATSVNLLLEYYRPETKK